LSPCFATISVEPKVRPSCSFVTWYRIGFDVSPSRGKRTWIDFTAFSGVAAAAAATIWARICPPNTRW
jgi:hypothetical protein